MKMRHAILIAGAAALPAVATTPASAHSLRGTCGEVGHWDAQVSTTNRATAHTITATVAVDHIPGSDYCTESNGSTSFKGGTQHNSLHARASGACLEVVAQRYTDGRILMWGYDCGAGGPANTQWISGYGAAQMRLWMSSGGGTSTTWATWYYRFDTQRWVFLGNVPNRPTYMTPWVESSGYNATLVRRTAFAGYTATNQYGTWAPVWSCPPSSDNENHQTMRMGVTPGNITFEHRASGAVECINSSATPTGATPGPGPGGGTGPTPTPTPTPTPSPGGLSGYYRIMARHSGKAVVVQSASTANGANVFQWTYGGTTRNDEWEGRSIGSGYYRLINRHSGKDLNVSGASTADGGNIIQYTYGGTTTNDEWAVVSLGNGYFRVTNRHSGKSAEVVGGGTTDGTNVAQRTYSGVTHQQFQFVSVP